jgi:site-specific DNA-methyltransferase (adenine-specific)
MPRESASKAVPPARTVGEGVAAVYLPFDALRPNPRNPRIHGAEVTRLARTILRTTWGAPVIAQASTLRIIGGHGRLEAAKLILAGVEVDGILRGGADHRFDRGAPGPALVPVRLVDVSDAEAEAMTLADNASALQGRDDASLAVEMATRSFERGAPLMADMGYGADDLDRMVRAAGDAVLADAAGATGDVERHEIIGDAPQGEDPGAEEQQPDAPVFSKAGEVYDLGPHRLVCGDSRDAAVWARLMGGGKLRGLWTDPPYGVAVNAVASVEEAKLLHRRTDGLVVENDDLDEDALRALLDSVFALALASSDPGSAWYAAAPPGPLFGVFGASLRSIGVWRHTLVWVKQQFAFGRSDYHYRHESIFYGWVPGAAHYFVDDRTQDSVLEFDRPMSSKEHPTMKPVALVQKCIENSSKPGWLVGDPFGGSGTTLIACAQSGRVARLIELSPRYCDVIRRRWTKYARSANVDPGAGALD